MHRACNTQARSHTQKAFDCTCICWHSSSRIGLGALVCCPHSLGSLGIPLNGSGLGKDWVKGFRVSGYWKLCWGCEGTTCDAGSLLGCEQNPQRPTTSVSVPFAVGSRMTLLSISPNQVSASFLTASSNENSATEFFLGCVPTSCSLLLLPPASSCHFGILGRLKHDTRLCMCVARGHTILHSRTSRRKNLVVHVWRMSLSMHWLQKSKAKAERFWWGDYFSLVPWPPCSLPEQDLKREGVSKFKAGIEDGPGTAADKN